MNNKGIEFEHFDKKYCYSFVLQHPKKNCFTYYGT